MRKLLPAALAAVFASACAAPPISNSPEPASMLDPTVPGVHMPQPTLITGGQPGADAWSTLRKQGVTTVVNLRPDAEMAGRDEAAEVRAAGMAYHQIPVDGAAGITLDKARQLQSLLQQSDGRILVHCASGNRVGALIALGAADAGATPEQAIQQGKAAGMTSTEARVRELLEMPAQP